MSGKKILIKTGCCIALVFSALSAMAQDYREDMQKIVQALKQTRSYAIEVDVSVYSFKGGSRLYHSDASVKCAGETKRYELGSLKVFQNDRYLVQVDDEEHSVVIYDCKKDLDEALKLVASLHADQFTDLSTITDKVEVPEFVGEDTAGNRVYRMKRAGEESTIEVTLDPKAGKIVRITYELPQESDVSAKYIVLNYTRFTTSATFSPAFYSTDDFFTVKNGNIVLNPAYSTYKLYSK